METQPRPRGHTGEEKTMSFFTGLLAVFSIGIAALFVYVLVRAVRFFDRADQALDIYLSEKAREQYENWPPRN